MEHMGRMLRSAQCSVHVHYDCVSGLLAFSDGRKSWIQRTNMCPPPRFRVEDLEHAQDS